MTTTPGPIAAIERERKAVTDEMLAAYAAAHREVIDSAISDYSKIAIVADDARRAGIAAALSALVEDQPVAVKALEWSDGYAFCRISGRHWHVAYSEGRRGFTLHSRGMPDAGHKGNFPTEEAAQAAAQTEYERRIRSALAPLLPGRMWK